MKIRQTALSFLCFLSYLVKLIRFVREHAPIVLSVGLHLLVVILLTVDFISTEAKDKVVSVPMFVVDLDKVKVAEMTNLPPKLDKTKKASASAQKSVKTSSYSKAGASLSRGGSGSGAKSSSGAHLSNDLDKVLTKVTKKKSSKTDEAVASMLNSLKNARDLSFTKEQIQKAIAACGFPENVRGEALDIHQFAALTKAFCSCQEGGHSVVGEPEV